MNSNLERLVKLYDSLQDAGDDNATWLLQKYETALEEILSQHRGLTARTLHRAVRVAHSRWLKAQNKPASMPPKA